jgi:hypothetical protein
MTNPQTKSKSSELSELAIMLLWADVLRDLAMEENKAGQIARMILRAERDGQGDAVKHLVEALGLAIVKAMPRLRKRDAAGRWRLDLDLPAEWRD